MTWKRATKTLLRDSLAELLHAVGVTRLPRRQLNQLTIVTFHRVLPQAQLSEYPIKAIAATPEEFEWFLGVFREHFTCGPLFRVARLWQTGDYSKPPLAITFDDGQLDNYTHARPILSRLGLQATFYVTAQGAQGGQLLWHDRMAYALVRLLSSSMTAAQHDLCSAFSEIRRGFSSDGEDIYSLAARAIQSAKGWPAIRRGQWLEHAEQLLGSVAPQWDGMMTVRELRALAQEGHEIGCHSRSHEILPALGDAQLYDEIVASKASLEQLTGYPCTTFCYPNGDYDARCAGLVREHYSFAVTTRWGTNALSCDPLSLRRLDMVASHSRSGSGKLSVPTLAWRMSGLYPGLRS